MDSQLRRSAGGKGENVKRRAMRGAFARPDRPRRQSNPPAGSDRQPRRRIEEVQLGHVEAEVDHLARPRRR